MAKPKAYIVCATPRTGSTLLCSLLSSTDVLGHPQSYFRAQDEEAWAERFDLPVADGKAIDYRAFVVRARAMGETPNGVFAARIMWGSLDPLVERLDLGAPDLAALQNAFGPTAFVHLRRASVIEQAVSWSRAEQTGYWQRGDIAVDDPRLDLDRLLELVRTIEAHNSAWQSWFRVQEIEPLALTYEEVVRDQRAAVQAIAQEMSVAVPRQWGPKARERRQADETNAAHVAALREALRPPATS